MNPKNDKQVLIALAISAILSVASVIVMISLGAGFWSIFGLSPMVVLAEWLGRRRNGI